MAAIARPQKPPAPSLLLAASLWIALSPAAPADDRIQSRLIEPKLASRQEGYRVYFIQVGAYPTLKQAAYLRSIVQNLGPVRVEKAGGTYRVLLGRFGDEAQADGFIAEHKLRKLFPELWVDVITSDISGGPGNGATEIPLTEQEKDPRTLNIDLYCAKDQKRGRYVAQFAPEKGQPEGTASMDVKWSCATPAQEAESWAEQDRERNPSFVGISPIAAMGTFGATGGTLGDLSLSHFSYGFQVSAFRTFGGIGPIAEYRLINARYSGGAGTPTPIFNLQHSALAGVRLPIKHRFELEPLVGFASQPFLLGTTLADASFKSAWTPQLMGRVRLRAFELSERASIDLTAGYGYFLPGSNADVSATTGMVILGQVRARHFSQDGWGADWYFEFNSISRSATGLSQGESLFRFGVSFLVEMK